MATRQITSTLASMRAKQFIVTIMEISKAHENFKRLEKNVSFCIKTLPETGKNANFLKPYNPICVLFTYF